MYNLAILDFNKAVRLRPDDSRVYRARGYAYYMLCKYGKAIGDCNRSLRIDSKQSFLYVVRAMAYLCQDRESTAGVEDLGQLGENFAFSNEPAARRSVHRTRQKLISNAEISYRTSSTPGTSFWIRTSFHLHFERIANHPYSMPSRKTFPHSGNLGFDGRGRIFTSRGPRSTPARHKLYFTLFYFNSGKITAR